MSENNALYTISSYTPGFPGVRVDAQIYGRSEANTHLVYLKKMNPDRRYKMHRTL